MSKLRFKNRIKQNLHNFLLNDIEESLSLQKFEKLLRDFYAIISPTFEDYVNGKKQIKRQIIILILRFIGFSIVLRYAISGIYNNKWILSIMSDGNHLFGNQD